MRIVQIDAFATVPFTGNPAAVCLLEAYPDDAFLQAIASEMNLSETAFLVPRAGEPGAYRLRWFTPTAEVDLCGHATLASAHFLFAGGHADPDTVLRLHTLSGVLSVRKTEAGLTMDFPAEPPDGTVDPDVLQGIIPDGWSLLARNRMDLFVAYEHPQTVLELVPDLSRLAAVAARGLIVTAPARDPDGRCVVAERCPDADFISRFFAPALGVPEDPVTGSAHCALAPYWVNRLGGEGLVGYQASVRGGRVAVAVHGDRVQLTGRAVTILQAELLVDRSAVYQPGTS